MNSRVGLRIVKNVPVPLCRGNPGAVPRAWWLGQAGFLLEAGGLRVLIDPYLSDSLEAKYRGSAWPHERRHPVPVAPGELRDIDWVLVTHGHTDHLDPETIPALAAANPGSRFVLPQSCAALGLQRGIPGDRLVGMRAGGHLELGGGNMLFALPAAHETLATDEEGRHLFLGYVLRLGDLTIYHSGDCVPYDGLIGKLHDLEIDVALLPVNGRDAVRAAAGFAGNFTLGEAADLVLSASVGIGVGHHFGMFDFNTLDLAEGREILAGRPELADRFVLAQAGAVMEFLSA